MPVRYGFRRFGDDDDFDEVDLDEMLRLLADDFMESGDLEEAMDRHILAVARLTGLYAKKGYLCEKKKQLSAAVECYDTAISLLPSAETAKRDSNSFVSDLLNFPNKYSSIRSSLKPSICSKSDSSAK